MTRMIPFGDALKWFLSVPVVSLLLFKAEGLFLYGSMLLIIDIRIPGAIRERMLVSYHRYQYVLH